MMSFPDKALAHLVGSSGPVHAVAYSASPSTYILTGSADRSVRLYNPFPSGGTAAGDADNGASRDSSSSSYVTGSGPGSGAAAGKPRPLLHGRLIQTYSAHAHPVLALAVAPDNARFASAGGDRAVLLWDVAGAGTAPLRRLGTAPPHGHTGRVNAVAFGGADVSLLASGGFDTTVRLWDLRTTSVRPIQILEEARDSVTSVVLREVEIVAGSVDGRVRSYDVRTGRCVVDVVGASVTAASLTRDTRAMLVGSLDSTVRIMDRDTGACLRVYRDAERTNEELRLPAILGGKEKWVVAGDEGGAGKGTGDGTVWAWEMLTGKLVARIKVPWGAEADGRKVLGSDGREKERVHVTSCMAWKEDGWGDQFCVGGTSGVVTVFGTSQ